MKTALCILGLTLIGVAIGMGSTPWAIAYAGACLVAIGGNVKAPQRRSQAGGGLGEPLGREPGGPRIPKPDVQPAGQKP